MGTLLNYEIYSHKSLSRFFLPFAVTQTGLTREVIFIHSENDDSEIWQIDAWDTRSTHRIFKRIGGYFNLNVYIQMKILCAVRA